MFSGLAKTGFAQVEAIPYYSNLNFNHSFFTIAENDAKSNYYAVDLSMFKSDVERAYFENKAFSESKLVRLDAGNANIAWFKAKKVYSDQEIGTLLLQLKDLTINTVASMSESQKQQWLSPKGK